MPLDSTKSTDVDAARRMYYFLNHQFLTGIIKGDADDDQRPHFLIDHLRTVGQAIADDYDIRSYYCWTISDNFEWQVGKNARFFEVADSFGRCL